MCNELLRNVFCLRLSSVLEMRKRGDSWRICFNLECTALNELNKDDFVKIQMILSKQVFIPSITKCSLPG